jgi:preprotein translocase subunit Sec61beta
MTEQLLMSARKRKEAPMPASGAGLLRFFEEESKGIKIRPEAVVIGAALLIALTTILRWLAPF